MSLALAGLVSAMLAGRAPADVAIDPADVTFLSGWRSVQASGCVNGNCTSDQLDSGDLPLSQTSGISVGPLSGYTTIDGWTEWIQQIAESHSWLTVYPPQYVQTACNTQSRGWMRYFVGVWYPIWGDSSCESRIELELLAPARAELQFSPGGYLYGSGHNSVSITLSGPTSTRFSLQQTDVADASIASSVVSLSPGHYVLRVAGTTSSPAEGGAAAPNTAAPFVNFQLWKPRCANGPDDDGDGLADLADPDCTGPDDISEEPDCADGADNDGDGLADLADPGCRNPNGATESPQCQDGINNDGDGLIDFDGGASLNGGVPLTAPDPQCVGKPWRNKESGNGCGLGVELALMFPLLRSLARRRPGMRPAETRRTLAWRSAVLALMGLVSFGSTASAAVASAEALTPLDGGIVLRAQRQIAEREYHATRVDDGLQAPNRAQRLRTWFEPTGVRVHDRLAGQARPLVEMRLARVGRGSSFADVAPGEVSHDGARVEIRRPGLVEWYRNAPEGLEQGFTLERRPSGKGDLVLEVGIEGARASARVDAVSLATLSGRTLRYEKLVAWDAAGRKLESKLEVPDASHIRLVVADAGARYPIVVDPLLLESPATAATQLESNQASAALGVSVAGAGDVNGDGYADVIVGATSYDAGQVTEGAAFVFLGGPTGVADGNPATAPAQLESNQSNALMGWSVAGAGDVNADGYDDVIVGAPQYDAGEILEGAAFVFLGSASGIADGNPTSAAARIESNQTLAFLGGSVAGAGDVNGDGYADVIVGANQFDWPPADAGLALVFHGSAAGVTGGGPASAAAQIHGDLTNALLGTSVAAAGDVNGDGYGDVIVGSPGYDLGQPSEGAAFVFLGSAAGVASGTPAAADTRLEGRQTGAALGSSVASAGDVNGDGYADVIAGAPYYDAGQSDEGAAFVFLGAAAGVADGWPAIAPTQLESNQAGAALGESVAGAGDVNGDGYADVIVGAGAYDSGHTDEGSAFLFLGSAVGILDGNPASAAAQAESNQGSASMGSSVAGAGDVNGDGYTDVIVGAPNYDVGQTDEGAAFLFAGRAAGHLDGSPFPAAWSFESDQATGWAGHSVASAGDIDGDGYADVVIGIPLFDAGEVDEGAVLVFRGGAAGLATTPLAAIYGDQAGAQFGIEVASAGDVNGDGHADLLLGADRYDAGETDEGAAFLFLGSAGGIVATSAASADARFESDQSGAGMGLVLSAAGDVNGDGYGDILVGAPFYDAGNTDEGVVIAYLGSGAGIANGTPATAHARFEADQTNAQLGSGVASAGDVNGDGYADVIIGAFVYDNGISNEGTALIYHGSPTGLTSGSPATANTRIEGEQLNARLGLSVAAAGDVNGDGYGDVIVGAQNYDSGQNNEGVAAIFHGSAGGVPNGSPATAASRLEGDQDEARMGHRVAGVGDTNGDGYADVLVGAYGYNSYSNGFIDGGAAFVFRGGASGVPSGGTTSAVTWLESDQDFALLGYDVAGAGDVNGDGFPDLLVGAIQYDAGQTDEGKVFLYLGNAGAPGRRVLARQRASGAASALVQPWGMSAAADRITVQLDATHPEGAGRVRLEAEACPPGAAFGDTECIVQQGGTWASVDPASPIAVLTHEITGLTPNTLYRWRARVLRAPATGPLPANPERGPWWRHTAQLVESDIRTAAVLVTECSNGIDDDGDSLVDHPEDTGCTGPADTSERDDVAVLPPGPSGTTVGGGAGAPGGVTVAVSSTAGGTFSGEAFALDPSDLPPVEGIAQAQFQLPSDPVLYWQLEFDGTLAEPATLTFAYDAATLTVPESSVTIYHFVDTNADDVADTWVALDGVRDLVANTITVTVDHFSAFALGLDLACRNGLDDDGDGLGDLADPGCANSTDDSERDAALPCDDGIDNDGDGYTDYVFDANQDGISDAPGDPACFSPTWSRENAQCQDGSNNDGKLGTDYDGGVSILGPGNADPAGADPQCVGAPWKNKEAASSCGIGVELALAIPLLAALRRRRQ